VISPGESVPGRRPVRPGARLARRLSIYLVPESPQPGTGYANLRGALRIKWGTTELSAPWQVSL
jgi:hypothetical protein